LVEDILGFSIVKNCHRIKSAVFIGACAAAWFGGSYGNSVWADGLDAALDDVSISTESSDKAPKEKPDACAEDSQSICSSMHEHQDAFNATSSTTQGNIHIEGNVQNVIINGAPSVNPGNPVTTSLGGF